MRGLQAFLDVVKNRSVVVMSDRDKILEFVQPDASTATGDQGASFRPEGQVHAGPSECSGGQAEQTESGSPLRVVDTSRYLPSVMEDLGETSGGSVRHRSQQQTDNLHVSNSGLSCSVDRRNGSVLEQPGSLLLSADVHGTSGPEQGDGVNGTDINSDRPPLATAGVVPRAVIPFGGQATINIALEETTQAVSLGQVPSSPGHAPPSRLEAIQQSLRSKGFSRKAAFRIARTNRLSTTNPISQIVGILSLVS